jgi:hypothetical protein
MTPEEKKLVEVVRSDPKIGRGTCAMIDECWEDEEIVEIIREHKLETADALLDALYEAENIWRERADDALQWGGERPFWKQVKREKTP